MIHVKVRGSFKRTEGALLRLRQRLYLKSVSKFGPLGVSALQAATPKRSSETANSWYYEIVDKPGYFSIHWLNRHTVEPGTIPLAVLIQYGHATRTGGYVEGLDYINPAIQPIFDQIADEMWKEVIK